MREKLSVKLDSSSTVYLYIELPQTCRKTGVRWWSDFNQAGKAWVGELITIFYFSRAISSSAFHPIEVIIFFCTRLRSTWGEGSVLLLLLKLELELTPHLLLLCDQVPEKYFLCQRLSLNLRTYAMGPHASQRIMGVCFEAHVPFSCAVHNYVS